MDFKASKKVTTKPNPLDNRYRTTPVLLDRFTIRTQRCAHACCRPAARAPATGAAFLPACLVLCLCCIDRPRNKSDAVGAMLGPDSAPRRAWSLLFWLARLSCPPRRMRLVPWWCRLCSPLTASRRRSLSARLPRCLRDPSRRAAHWGPLGYIGLGHPEPVFTNGSLWGRKHGTNRHRKRALLFFARRISIYLPNAVRLPSKAVEQKLRDGPSCHGLARAKIEAIPRKMCWRPRQGV
jgi:hypothetical protein